LALAVPLSRFTSRVGGGSTFYFRPIRDMQDAQTSEESQPPLGLAGFVCLVYPLLVYRFTEPLFSQCVSSPVRLLLYFISPPMAAFTVLYLSCWRRDLPKAKRILTLIYRSCIVFGIVVLFSIAMLAGLLALAIGNWYKIDLAGGL